MRVIAQRTTQSKATWMENSMYDRSRSRSRTSNGISRQEKHWEILTRHLLLAKRSREMLPVSLRAAFLPTARLHTALFQVIMNVRKRATAAYTRPQIVCFLPHGYA